MEKRVRLIIYNKKSVYDIIFISPNSVLRNSKKCRDEKTEFSYLHLNKKGVDACLVSVYVKTLEISNYYRKCAFRKLCQFLENSQHSQDSLIFVKLVSPKQKFLDYKWNEITTRFAREMAEIDNMMSWLSTLGGAFSALGEEFKHCAEMAGKISMKQFELALRLGDPLLGARCKLYASISLIQRGCLRYPRYIIRDVYSFSKRAKDIRLQRMCLGIWANLKYCRSKRRQANKLKKGGKKYARSNYLENINLAFVENVK